MPSRLPKVSLTACSSSSSAAAPRSRPFSSDAGAGSREENVSRQKQRSVLVIRDRISGSITGRTATGGMAQPSFFERPPSSTLASLAALAEAHLVDASRGGQEVRGLASLDEAGPMHLTFFDNLKYADQLASTKAGACLVSERFEAGVPAHVAVLRAAQPFREFVKIARELYSDALRPQSWFGNAGIAASAIIDPPRLPHQTGLVPLLLLWTGRPSESAANRPRPDPERRRDRRRNDHRSQQSARHRHRRRHQNRQSGPDRSQCDNRQALPACGPDRT